MHPPTPILSLVGRQSVQRRGGEAEGGPGEVGCSLGGLQFRFQGCKRWYQATKTLAEKGGNGDSEEDEAQISTNKPIRLVDHDKSQQRVGG